MKNIKDEDVVVTCFGRITLNKNGLPALTHSLTHNIINWSVRGPHSDDLWLERSVPRGGFFLLHFFPLNWTFKLWHDDCRPVGQSFGEIHSHNIYTQSAMIDFSATIFIFNIV